VSVDNKIEKLNSEIVELRELILARNNDSVPRTLDSAGENINTSTRTEAQMATCSHPGTIGYVTSVTNMDKNPDHLSVKSPVASSVLGNSEFSLPLFDESSETNPMFHLKQLEEFFQLKGISQAYQLVVARKSIVGKLSRQWLEAVSDKLKNYEDFKQAFLNTWWSPSQQSLVKCSIYQGKYDRRSNLTLSDHFLKYATMASYLEPRPSDTEIIEAIRYHFPIHVQRTMLGTQLRSIGEALDLLKRVELMEGPNPFHDTASNTPARPVCDRNKAQGQVRRVQRFNVPSGNQRYNHTRGRHESRRDEISDNEESQSPRRRNLPDHGHTTDNPRSGRRTYGAVN
jgi:hypothetical protein